MRASSNLYYLKKFFHSYSKRNALLAAIFTSVFAGGAVLYSAIQTDSQMLKMLVGHVTSLVETQDRPELQRLLGSSSIVAGKTLVIENGRVFSSSSSLAELDRSYNEPARIRLTENSSLSKVGLLTEFPLVRKNGDSITKAKIVKVSPLLNLLFFPVLVTLVVLSLGLFIGGKLGEAFSERKAKELSADSYRRLIHDLHNPIAALGVSARIALSPDLTADERSDASRNIPKIAGQILNQIQAAKENLEFDAKILKDKDVRSCISDAIEQAKLSSTRNAEFELVANIPVMPIVVPHDERLIRRAIGNLVRNAIDACGSKVIVDLQKDNQEMLIRIQDDGPGMTLESVAQYLQGRGRSTKGDRQAFGLSAVNHIARSHGGRVVYRRSTLGGSCFEIRLSG